MKRITAICMILIMTASLFIFGGVYALDGIDSDHEKGLYTGEANISKDMPTYQSTHSHIDHSGSEECIHDCEHGANTVNGNSSKRVLSEDEVESLLTEYNDISTREEMKAFVARLEGVSVDEIDFDALCPIREELSDAEIIKKINEITGLTSDSLDEAFDRLAEYLGVSEKELPTRNEMLCVLSGGHSYHLWGCTNTHTYIGNCTVRCQRYIICLRNCGFIDTVFENETSHTWSVGWCGQTCKVCGLIELFHNPGGCWYCS